MDARCTAFEGAIVITHQQLSPRSTVAPPAVRGPLQERAVVVGGGIHGITAALALASDGYSVCLVERLPRLLAGTSAATHNRAHLGFHYPRCDRTAEECKQGLEHFAKRYPQALHDPGESYYFIEHGSRLTGDEYALFCDRLGLSYRRQWPSGQWLIREQLADSFLTREPCFDLTELAQALTHELRACGVRLLTGWTVTSLARSRHGEHRVVVTDGLDSQTLPAEVVVNATYALANDVLTAARLDSDRTLYSYHTTEVVVARYTGPQLPAVTVMDGPYISIMPLAGATDKVLVYDVEYSVRKRQRGYSYKSTEIAGTNWPKMQAHGSRYFNFMKDLQYVKSLWGSRPTRIGAQNDSRNTRIVAHRAAPGFYSILEGKFISAPLAAEALARQIHAGRRD